MTAHVVIRENVAGPGSTQINNVNLTTGTLDSGHSQCERHEANDGHSAHQ